MESIQTASEGRTRHTDAVPLKLSDADRAEIRHKAWRGLLRILAAQAVMMLVVAGLSWLFAGWAAGASALVGAGAYFVPNALFALRLMVGLALNRQPAAWGFLVGELVKVATATLLLALAAYLARDWLVWPALLFGLVGVLKGYVLLLVVHKLP